MDFVSGDAFQKSVTILSPDSTRTSVIVGAVASYLKENDLENQLQFAPAT